MSYLACSGILYVDYLEYNIGGTEITLMQPDWWLMFSPSADFETPCNHYPLSSACRGPIRNKPTLWKMKHMCFLSLDLKKMFSCFILWMKKNLIRKFFSAYQMNTFVEKNIRILNLFRFWIVPNLYSTCIYPNTHWRTASTNKMHISSV